MEGTCRLKRFLQKEHTPAEKAMLVSAAALIGAAAGIILFSASGGINIEISIGSHNGCHNTGNGCDNTSTR
ncbi:hypothetical protein D1155_09615 [Anaerotruncus sp. 80]|jgi:hypothetical protein|uniref:Uncharacterized protein n=1 Tax=Anaerotruncus colihominis TaxID=169435 RepID=A0A845QJY5_9FIRM|nr:MULTISPECIES: hypothetical protein [Clostridia]MCI9638893.1 hypothetical protein [Emergencia sp.]NBH61906.1 hypothetical protein [Anaerotruncus colihominis]NCE97553.1 hypothetical protein [Emergencia sp. 1XD21-10]NCF02561.1 hypothetical protein [Anaerotruncus sp. 80]